MIDLYAVSVEGPHPQPLSHPLTLLRNNPSSRSSTRRPGEHSQGASAGRGLIFGSPAAGMPGDGPRFVDIRNKCPRGPQTFPVNKQVGRWITAYALASSRALTPSSRLEKEKKRKRAPDSRNESVLFRPVIFPGLTSHARFHERPLPPPGYNTPPSPHADSYVSLSATRGRQGPTPPKTVCVPRCKVL
ncbi:hypothetical protein SKAU_G00152370 [Synaphobranchus kaupii]|uniref:Uncharacterized protein n=1 Tax=Synaphobranchus kaupii TaxID=118154 RepID=A0A9Q1IZ34_SYNKA|nr:hypothetical protein SKAU_G00152370 [Synaphobranchus kaupii]